MLVETEEALSSYDKETKEKQDKELLDRKNAEEVRQKALESLGQMQKRHVEEKDYCKLKLLFQKVTILLLMFEITCNSGVITICVITFCVGKLLHFALIVLLHFALMSLHFVLVLHFAAIVITFCVSITFCRVKNGISKRNAA